MEDPKHPQPRLFMVRVWLENLDEINREWRGQVKYVSSGEVRYFRNRDVLISNIQSMLEENTQVES